MGDSLFLISMTGIIYKATNLFNDNVYIGQTTRSLSVRIRQHLSDAKPESTNPFHIAILQYGKDAFEWETLDEFSGTKEEVIHALNVAEEYHILKNRSMLGDRGYNATQGGYSSGKFADIIHRRAGGDSRSKRMLQYDLEGNFIRMYDSVTDVCRIFGISQRNNFVARGLWRGFQWRVMESDNFPRKIEPYKKGRKGSGLLVYTSDGDFYKHFTSHYQCKAELGKSPKVRRLAEKISLRRCDYGCMLVFQSTGGEYPMKIQVDIIEPKSASCKEPICYDIPVLQYTRDGKFVKEYPSIMEAERESGICRHSIRLWSSRKTPLVVRGERTKYLWQVKDGEIKEQIEVIGYKVKEKYVPKMDHQVAQYDQDDNLIKVWKNTYQASLQTGDSTNLIQKQCKGISTRKKPLYKWKYYTDSQVAI